MNYDWEEVRMMSFLIIIRFEFNKKLLLLKILKILVFFPNVTELKVCFNRIRMINSLDSNLMKYLRTLDIESNPIENWQCLKKLGELKACVIVF